MNEWNALRGKLVGGLGAGMVLPNGFVGLSDYNATGISEVSDTVAIYGLGAKVAVTPLIAAGLEHLVENKDDFDSTGEDLENSEVTLRLDFNF